MNRVANKNGMIARRATQVVVNLRCQGAQHRERPFLLQPIWAQALRAVYCVRLLAKGMTIRVVAFLASHPAKPSARLCGTKIEVPYRTSSSRAATGTRLSRSFIRPDRLPDSVRAFFPPDRYTDRYRKDEQPQPVFLKETHRRGFLADRSSSYRSGFWRLNYDRCGLHHRCRFRNDYRGRWCMLDHFFL